MVYLAVILIRYFVMFAKLTIHHYIGHYNASMHGCLSIEY